jgi:transposase
LEQGRFADLWSADARAPLVLTVSELALFLEGCPVVGQMALSPTALDPSADLKIHHSSFKS